MSGSKGRPCLQNRCDDLGLNEPSNLTDVLMIKEPRLRWLEEWWFKQIITKSRQHSNNEDFSKNQWDAIGSSVAPSSPPATGLGLHSFSTVGWDLCSRRGEETEQMVRLPVWAAPSVTDASQSSWPAHGSCSSLEAVRCSLPTGFLSVTAPFCRAQTVEITADTTTKRRSYLIEYFLFASIRLLGHFIKFSNLASTPRILILKLRIVHGSDAEACSLVYGRYHAS